MSEQATLWCVHTIGPDDVNAAPDFDTAERWAVRQNVLLREYAATTGMDKDPHWPEVRAVAAVWPWDAASHAADVPRSVAAFAPPASADRSPQGQDAEERLDAQHESAVGDSRDALLSEALDLLTQMLDPLVDTVSWTAKVIDLLDRAGCGR